MPSTPFVRCARALLFLPAALFAQTSAPADRPDPAEIPLPPIATALGRLPGVNELPVRVALPDVLTMDDGTKVTTPAQWRQRREEMKRTLEYYAIGQMPPAPGNVTGTAVKAELVAAGQVKYRLVHLAFGPNGQLALDVGIFTPAEGGPFPAIILQSGPTPDATPLPRLAPGPTQGRGEDVLLVVGPAAPPATPAPGGRGGAVTAEAMATRFAEVFRRGYALVVFNPNDCAEDTTLREADGSWSFRHTRFFPAYPGYDWGILAAWAWGASRVADYLATDPAIDHAKLMIITGASRNGKSALIAAAFDERLLGAPVVTGGGGVGAYRFAGPRHSETLDIMQKKYPNWFSPHLHEFWGQREKLPFDEHWFLALCAPRPFIALEGDTDRISLPAAVHQSFLAATPAYELLGAPGRLGVHYSHHAHAFTAEDWTALMNFTDRHLLGKRDFTFDWFPTDAELDAAAAPQIDPMKSLCLLPLLAAGLLVTGCTAPGPAAAPAGPVHQFNVRDFGATGDGVTKDTKAFQQALDACAVSGGGDVVVPAGKYLIGSIQLGTHTTLRLEQDSILTGSPDLDDYPIIDIRWEGRTLPGHRALIYAANVDHIGITGPGVLEGNPATAASNRPPRGTLVIEPINCTNILWEGFTVKQPGNNWATHPTFCSDLVVRNVTIDGGRDGIDIDSCQRVRIEGCTITTGDDSISLKSGRGLDGARLGRPTEDVLITNCRMTGRRFACIGIGSEISAGVRNIRIEHCEFTARTHAIYLKTRIGRAGVNENITADDIDVRGGDFLRLNLVRGGNVNTADDPVEGLPGYPVARGLAFSNIRLHGAKAIVIGTEVSALRPIEGLTLTNITGTATAGLTLANMKDVVLKDIKVTGFTGPLLGTVNVTGTGLEGAQPIPAPVDPPAGNSPGAAKATRTTLWNGTDLTGWKFYVNDPTVTPAGTVSVHDGVLSLATKASGYLKTGKDYSNYRLHVEWRWPKDAPANTNSGVLVHLHGPDAVWPLCFECQLKTGNAGQVVGLGLDIPGAPLQANRKRAPKFADSSEKPLGEWNTYEILCRRDTIEVFVNGVRQNRVDQLPAQTGAIGLQLEGFPVEFRNVWLESL